MTSQPKTEPVAEHLFNQDGTINLLLVRAERARRARLYSYCLFHDSFMRKVIGQARHDVLYYFNNFGWTYDPRLKMKLPMILWGRQREYVQFVEDCISKGCDFVAVKSWDVGVTYMNAGIAAHRWRFDPGFKTTFCANKLNNVDQRGNPDSIFEKIRGFIREQPRWIRPEGYQSSRDDTEAKLLNPANANIISGEGGDNAGRGGRSTWFCIDEAAHVERADSVNAATSANARTRGWVSSVNGTGNLFYQLAHNGNIPVFTFHYRSDPRKNDDWARDTKKRLTPPVFAAEYDLDWGASMTGLTIPSGWVDAARELYRRMEDQLDRYRAWRGFCGVDIGAGKAESTAIVRHGPVIDPPVTRMDPDSTRTAIWALDVARVGGAAVLNYDSVGVGFAIGSIMENSRTSEIDINGVNTGLPPTERIWPDGRTSAEKFVNLKAELWWLAREAFNRSWLLLRHLDGDSEGIDYALDEVLLLGGDDELARQLSMPRWFRTETGKIMIEKKDQLAKRGIPSPDRADGAMLSLYEPEPKLFYVGDAQA